MKIRNILMTAAICCTSAIFAQNTQENGEFRKNNWFLTAGGTTEAWMNKDGYVLGTAKGGFGVWVNPYLGLKLEGVAGNTRLLENSRGQVFGAHLSYMAHILGAKKYSWFNLLGVVGGGYYMYKSGSIFDEYSKYQALNANVGVQALFNVAPRWSIYLQPDMVMQPKYYDPANREKFTLSAALTLGVNYTFRSKFVGQDKVDVLQAEKDQLNDEVNRMRKELSEANSKLAAQQEETVKAQREAAEAKEAAAETAGQQKVTPDMAEYTAFFSINSAILSKQEVVNLEAIADVMKQFPQAKYRITGYADKQTGSAEFNRKVSRQRAEAVYNTLADKFGVNRDQMIVEGAGGVDTMHQGDPKLSRAAVITVVR